MPLRCNSKVVTAVTLGLVSGACFTYAPLEAPVPQVGSEVRARLADPIDVQVGDMTLNGVNQVEGRVYRAQADSVMVYGDWVYTQVGSRYPANGGALLLARDRIGSLQVRRLSPGRSGIAGVAAVGVMFLVFRLVESALGGGNSTNQPPDPN